MLDVKLNFRADFRRIIDEILIANAIELDLAEDYGLAVYRYFANARRRVTRQRYTVVEAKELVCPSLLMQGYEELKSELEVGADVTARLSRKRHIATFEDQLLNEWGIVHFHVGCRDAQGDVPGNDAVLFAFISGEVMHCIGFFPHRSWSNIKPLEILQRNWPEVIEHARAWGLTGYEWSEAERARFRKHGGNVLSLVNGVVYTPSAVDTLLRGHRCKPTKRPTTLLAK